MIAFGLLPAGGAAWLQSGVFDLATVLLAVPLGIWVMLILWINEVPDRKADAANGKRTLVDGPFSEAKEMVGGYFLVECASREDAVAIAGAIPAAEWATVEVREFGPCFT